MNAVTKPEAVSAQTLESVLGTGDLSKLNAQQRVEYMVQVCKTVGLNPLTRPFRFMNFQGQVTMYATRDCADQLRSSRRIDLTIVDKTFDEDAGLFIVTARAKTPDGRQDEDLGAVTMGTLKGDARANAIMKAITKAKRRVTLSICGLGFLDESEVETLHGARTIDAEPILTTAQAIQDDLPTEADQPYPFMTAQGGSRYATAIEWQGRWDKLIRTCQSPKFPDGMDKLRSARDLNAPAFAAVEAFDAKAVAVVRAALDTALTPAADWPSDADAANEPERDAA
jgi:hypothetical protein